MQQYSLVCLHRNKIHILNLLGRALDSRISRLRRQREARLPLHLAVLAVEVGGAVARVRVHTYAVVLAFRLAQSYGQREYVQL